MPCARRRCGGAHPVKAPTRTRAAPDRVEAEERAQQLGAAGADQAGDAEHLAAAQRERRGRRLHGAANAVQFEHGLAGRVRGAREQLVEPAAGHHARRCRTPAVPRDRPAPTVRPSRSTVKRSAIACTSSRKWEM